MNLTGRFLESLAPAQAEALRGHEPALAELLEGLCARAEAAHPGVQANRPRFVAALAAHLPADGDPLRGLAALRSSDLYLAGAAAAGEATAVAAVDALLSLEVDAAAASLRAASSLADEVKGRLRAHMLVGDADRPPALADYAGRGDLRGFLRISATREHLRLLRGQRREVGMGDDDLSLLAPAVDPELERMKLTYRGPFTACFGEALRGLTPRERTLLRHQAIDRLTIDQIGALYGAHRATAARWLERARRKVAELTEELLAERLAVDSVEAASIIRLVRSQLHVTLERLLADDPNS